MNYRTVTGLFLLSMLMITSVATAAADATAKKQAEKPNAFVAAYYFHGNFRCPTCRKIERYSKEAIELNFPEQLKSGAVIFQSVNIDQPENKHFVQDYQLVTKSLVLVKYENGKQVAWKNPPAVWQHVGDQQAFFDYVKKEVAAYL